MVKKIFYVILFITIIFINSCETVPPTSSNITANSKIIVNSNIDGALIFLNGNSTGKFTPDTILTTSGTHVISLQKDGYISNSKEIYVSANQVVTIQIELIEAVEKKAVLLEEFSNVSCVPCVASNIIVKSLSDFYGKEKLIVLRYHTNFPSQSDLFYNANVSMNNARMTYYSVMATPYTRVDGIHKPISSDSTKVKERIDIQLNEIPKFKIVVKDSLGVGRRLYINIEIEILDNSGINFSDLVLHTAIVEEKIEFVTPPGSNGENKFYDIVREMLPNSLGESLSGLQSNNKLSFSREITLNSNWNSSEIKTVVFIQDKTTKKVYQSKSTF